MRRARRAGNPLVRLGVFLVIIGFGSVLLHSATDYQFTLLMWADGAQPYIGIVVGLIGVGLLASPFLLRARQGGATVVPGAPPAAFNQPQGFEQQGFPQPQGFEQQGFPQQQGFEQQGFPQQGFNGQQGFPQPQGFAQPTGFPQQQAPTGFPAPSAGFAQQPQFGMPPQGAQPAAQPPFGPGGQQPGPTGWPR